MLEKKKNCTTPLKLTSIEYVFAFNNKIGNKL